MTTARGTALAIVLLLPAVALAQDTRPSEDEMFGEEPPAPAPPAAAPQEPPPPAGPDAPTDPRAQEPPSSPVQERAEPGLEPGVSQEQAIANLREAYDKLAIGGLLYLTTFYQLQDAPNPGNDPLSSPDLLDLYLDARPSDRVRGFTRLRLTYNPAIVTGDVDPVTGQVRDQSQFILDQLWVKLDVARQLFITVGKQRIKWGVGRFWNPTDFLNQQRLDPLAVLDLRTGVYLVKLHFPLEALGWNVYGILNLQDATSPREVGGALRAELLAGPAEFAVTAALREQKLPAAFEELDNRRRMSVRLGLDGSTAAGPFDLRAEAALLRGSNLAYVPKTISQERATAFVLSQDPAALRETREDEWFAQVLVGAEIPVQYSDQDFFTLGAEYFFNGPGSEDETLFVPGVGEVPLLPVLFATGAYQPLYVGRHYAAAYGVLAGPGNWDTTAFILSWIGNLSDNSSVLRFDYRVSILQYLRFDAHVTGNFGEGELRPRWSLPVAIPAGRLQRFVPPDAEVGAGIAMDL